MAMASSIVEAYCKISRAKTDIGVFEIKGIFDLRWIEKKAQKKFCLNPYENTKDSWVICGDDQKEMTKWFCFLLKKSGLQKDDNCDPRNYMGSLQDGKIIIKTFLGLLVNILIKIQGPKSITKMLGLCLKKLEII